MPRNGRRSAWAWFGALPLSFGLVMMSPAAGLAALTNYYNAPLAQYAVALSGTKSLTPGGYSLVGNGLIAFNGTYVAGYLNYSATTNGEVTLTHSPSVK
jgi:hypothetical protein